MNETFTIQRKNDERIDALEAALLLYHEECALVHTFTPGLYSREMAALAGQLIVGKIHLTQHQYCILRGGAYVMANGEDWGFVKAPFVGITQPGTRRVFYVTEDMSWISFHPTDKTDVDEIEADIIESRVNTILGVELKQQLLKLYSNV